MNIKERLDLYADKIESALEGFLTLTDCREKSVIEAMRYALLGGGKRIRPALLLEFYRIYTGNMDPAIPFACALEMIHSYSLIHDDLPCMDNDDFRRGKPSCHKKFGETNALLAGDALLSLAFETAMSTDMSAIKAENIVKCGKILGEASGAHGMVGGQVIDLESEGKETSIDHLKDLHSKKTGALIKAAAVIGSVLGGANEEQQLAAEKYSHALGLQFQIIDDILDVTSTEAQLGKPIGSDAGNHKTTYVTLYGVEGAKKIAEQLSVEAKESLQVLGSPQSLEALADYLCGRLF